jgi:hypothetical protein
MSPYPPPGDPLAPVVLPLHKRAFGTAFAVAGALVVFLATAIYVVRNPPEPRIDLGLLSQYFAGYTVSWTGALIGAAWAGFAGFILGWFFAFSRNFVMAVMLVFVRARAELVQTRDFLDQI